MAIADNSKVFTLIEINMMKCNAEQYEYESWLHTNVIKCHCLSWTKWCFAIDSDESLWKLWMLEMINYQYLLIYD